MSLSAQLALCKLHICHCLHNWHCMNSIYGIVCIIGIVCTIGIVCIPKPKTDMGLSVSPACVTRGGARPRGRLVLAALEIVVCIPLREVNHCTLLARYM